MHKHVLIATDGSDYALKAAEYGLGVAKAAGAKVSVVMVTPPWADLALSEIAVGRFEDEFADRMSTYAKSCLAKVETAARDRGLACETIHVAAAKPYQAIIDTAGARGCDLIVVGAHGRRGLAGLVLGSETVKVLTHSKIPILVYRG